jgi:carbon starvation protein
LWPLFGAINQLLAGLAFMVIAFYLIRHDRPIAFLVVPGILMIILPAVAMWMNIYGWYGDGKWLLVGVGLIIEGIQFWTLLEGALMWRKAKGVLPEPLPPLGGLAVEGTSAEGGRSF